MEFLVGIASAIVGEITKSTIAPIGRQLGYLFHYQSNVDKLRDKMKELEVKKKSIDRQVEDGRRRGEETHEEVKEWLKIVKMRSENAGDMLKDEGHDQAKCSCSGSFPNLVLRHQLSRKLKKMAETIASEIQKADSFQNITSCPPFKRSFENKDFEVFATRTPTLKEIMEALKDPNCRRIGVYGIGGVGKTTLMQEVARQAQEEEKIFSAVVMVTVSQSFDIMNIQKEIAENLGLRLKDESVSVRAGSLQDRLKSEKNILIIFDDVWEKLELKDVGIIFDNANQKGCKILVVSRNRYVLCNGMGVEKDIEVGVLPNEEAMKLFNKFVGNTGEEHKFKDLATAIVGECGGLPIAIVPIASALRNRASYVWKNALNKLKECPREGYETAYPSIKTSYDFLKSKQEKLILLLCSLHEEDTNVSVEDLMRIYGAYSDMFLEVDTLEEARISVFTSIDNLKGCCLLLRGDMDGTVKLDDVIRQIMVSIALEEHTWCFEKLEKLKQYSNSGKLKDSTTISLIDRDINQLPENLACPRLKLLLMDNKSHNRSTLFLEGFFEEAKELRALCLRSFIVKPLPLVSSSFQNLQTLSLQKCYIKDIAFIGELDNLVILDLSNSMFEQLPQQIGKLTRLRQLNLNNCVGLKLIRPNVISRLVQLEELYMDRVHIEWRMKTIDGESTGATIDELNMLQLRALHLCISDASVLPKCVFVDANLERFNIIVGYKGYHGYHATSSKLLQLQLHQQSQLQEYGFQKFMKECEVLHLGTLPGVNNIICQLDADGFPQLKKLYIHNNDEVQHIVESTGEIQPCSAFKNLEYLELDSVQNLEKICCGTVTIKPFGQVRRIKVSRCNKLKNVLRYVIDNRLETIEVVECNSVKEIVYLERDDAISCDEIELTHLRSVTLKRLPNLSHFFSSKMETTICNASSTITPGIPLFDKVAFPSLEILELWEMGFSNLWSNQLPGNSTMQNLTRLDVTRCHKLKYVFPFVIVGGLMQLERLHVTNCSAMEEIIIGVEEERMSSRKILFPKLKYLRLDNLKSLQSFCDGDCNVDLKSLLELTIKGCPLLKTFTTKTRVDQEIEQPLISEKVVFKNLRYLSIQGCKSILFLTAETESLQHLKMLSIERCELVEEVVVVTKEAGYDEQRNLKKISFPKLEILSLHHLPKLKRFCLGDCTTEFPSLLKLEIINCPKLKTFIAKSTPSTTVIEKDVEEREVLEEILFSRKVIFKNLQQLIIQSCDSILSLASETESLQHLKTLSIERCELMEEVVVVTKEAGYDQQRNMKKISFPKLEILILRRLPKLERFSLGDCSIEFPSLLELGISYCPELKTFIAKFTPSTTLIEKDMEEREVAEEILFSRKVIFKNLQQLIIQRCDSILSLTSETESLQHLKTLSIERCELMEEVVVVTKEAGYDQQRNMKKISFPKLEILILRHLPRLKRFSLGDCSIEFPSLLELGISYCPELKTFIAKFTPSTALIEKDMEEREVAEEILFSRKIVFKTLQYLTIEECDSLLALWELATSDNIQLLMELKIYSCELMEEILVVGKEAGGQERKLKKISFPKLESLKLKNLPKLKRFCQGDCTIEFLSALEIEIHICTVLRTYIANSTCSTSTTERVVKEREMAEEVLFNGKVVLKNLQRLIIQSCRSILSLTSETESLQHLKMLGILRCDLMEEVVVVTKEAGSDQQRNMKKISFPKLESLQLINLPKLKRFCQGDCTIEFLSALEIKIQDCTVLSTFIANSTCSTSTIERVVEEREMAEEALFNRKVAFSNLKGLCVKDCENLKYLLPFTNAGKLVRLKKLEVTDCSMLEEIVVVVEEEEGEEGGGGMSSRKILFPDLIFLRLNNLKSLKAICAGDCTIGRDANFSYGDVTYCPLLETLNEKVAFPIRYRTMNMSQSNMS